MNRYNKEKKQYNQTFYDINYDLVQSSAEVIVPLILQLMAVNSVIDLGCGLGGWLSVFKNLDVDDISGIDGYWVNKDSLAFPAESFSFFDLKQPFRLERKFDLAISLEVAEHLPIEAAEIFVDSLVRIAPVILFSAAIPEQGGTNHLNEQWPEYWAQLFQSRGYVVIDCIRKKIWNDERVMWHYAQNSFIYAQGDRLADYALLKKEYELTNQSQLSIVHPKNYQHRSVRKHWHRLKRCLVYRLNEKALKLFRSSKWTNYQQEY